MGYQVVGIALLVVVVLAPMVLTTQGARVRGRGWPVALIAGALFPLTWAVWYVVDDRPGHVARQPVSTR